MNGTKTPDLALRFTSIQSLRAGLRVKHGEKASCLMSGGSSKRWKEGIGARTEAEHRGREAGADQAEENPATACAMTGCGGMA